MSGSREGAAQPRYWPGKVEVAAHSGLQKMLPRESTGPASTSRAQVAHQADAGRIARDSSSLISKVNA